ncbi:RNA polymerase sigma factor [Paraliomyxa miuraensis]|uniref:RNA polymerase sigma factor n=1 Tax=Paraliomyxa miuraensis TaxID=376150 RepID=UPI00224D31E0|nr:sigma-70 family RNA polymerase sigma factor [Paraliomyxa miuraensis]MCX4239186.1 sigma-70 family RNA polymerase sigma factor [Paraliomyxa miuraensis]
MPADDLTLLKRWRTGNKSAGEALVTKHYRELYNWLCNQLNGNRDLAADLMQQTVEVAVRKHQDIVTDFRAYLYGIAGFKLKAHLRRQPPSDDASPPSQLIDPAHGAYSVLSDVDDAKLLVKALRSLSIEAQTYIMWAYVDGLTHPEIAARVGLATSQVNGRITRAREKLRKRLEELSRSPEQRGSIDKGFDTWVISLRRRIDDDSDEGPDC